jgi:hypothetical protein
MPLQGLPLQLQAPCLFNSDSNEDPLATVVPAKRWRSHKSDANAIPADKKGRSIAQFNTEAQRTMVTKAADYFKLHILGTHAFPGTGTGDVLDRALLKAWRTAHWDSGYAPADVPTLPHNVAAYVSFCIIKLCSDLI